MGGGGGSEVIGGCEVSGGRSLDGRGRGDGGVIGGPDEPITDFAFSAVRRLRRARNLRKKKIPAKKAKNAECDDG